MLAGGVPFAAEVEVDRIPELLGEIERMRAIRWARLTSLDTGLDG